MRVLIVSYRREDLLRRCVAQLGSYFGVSELLVVDNHSAESNSIADYCESAGIEILRNDANLGFASAVNMGMDRIMGAHADPWVLLINPDTEPLLDPEELTKSAPPEWACITTFDSSAAFPWDSEKPIPNPWRAAWEDSPFGRFRLPQPFGSRYRSFDERHKGYLVGCYLIVSTAAWQRIGPFDERFWLYSEEADWCLRAYQAGLKCKVIPTLGYRHRARQASADDPRVSSAAMAAYRESRAVFIAKHWGMSGVTAYRTLLASLNGVGRLARFRRPGRRGDV